MKIILTSKEFMASNTLNIQIFNNCPQVAAGKGEYEKFVEAILKGTSADVAKYNTPVLGVSVDYINGDRCVVYTIDEELLVATYTVLGNHAAKIVPLFVAIGALLKSMKALFKDLANDMKKASKDILSKK